MNYCFDIVMNLIFFTVKCAFSVNFVGTLLPHADASNGGDHTPPALSKYCLRQSPSPPLPENVPQPEFGPTRMVPRSSGVVLTVDRMFIRGLVLSFGLVWLVAD